MNTSTETNIASTAKSTYYGDFAKLRGEDNYLSWKQDVHIHLRTLRLAEALNYEKSVGELSPDEKLKNENAVAALLVNMDNTYKRVFFKYEKARDIWQYLEHQFSLIWAADKPQLMCKFYTAKMKEKETLEKHFYYMLHLRDQLKVAKVDIDTAMFMAAFARSLTPFYSDALPALVTAKDMTIENMFSTLTHFRLQRETLSKSLVNSAYTASGDNTKRSVTRFAGQKQKENKFNTPPQLYTHRYLY